MAADTERFNSRFKRQDRAGGASAASGTRDRRRVFEDGGGERETVRIGSGISNTNSTASRYTRERGTNERTESPSSGGKTTVTATLTTKTHKLNINDDKDGAVDDEKETKPDEEEKTKKPIKKVTGTSANSSKKRQAKKNLREKRRSTGVVIMPGQQPSATADEDEKQTLENTAKNMDESVPGGASSTSASNTNNEVMTKQIEQYEKALEDLKDELAKVHKELDTLRNANLRLKDENSALLRVVGSLSGTGHK